MKGSLEKAALVMVLALSLSGCTQLLDDLENNVQRGPGSNYENYLTGDRRLVVELDHSPGALWDSGTQVDEHVRRQLERITAKDVRIRTSEDLPDRGNNYAWSTSQLRQLHQDYQDLSSDDSKVVMHALFVDGEYQDPNTLGLAYGAQVFATFQGKIGDISCANDAALCTGGETRTWKVNRAITVHEAGHLFGLVASPLPMVQDHLMEQDPNPDTPEDEAGDSHSSNEDSVMYYAVETRRGVTNIFGGEAPPYQFDQYDRQDAENQRSGS